MKYAEYANNVGYKGWIENAKGDVIGFVKENGKIIIDW